MTDQSAPHPRPVLSVRVESPRGTSATKLTYEEVSWFRKRWFLVVTFLFFIPAGLVILATGPAYQETGGQVFQWDASSKARYAFGMVLLLAYGVVQSGLLG